MVEATQLVPSALRIVPVLDAEVGKVVVEDNQFVPSDCKTFPAVPEVKGYVAVDQLGAAFAPDLKICPAVAVPDRIAPADAVE